MLTDPALLYRIVEFMRESLSLYRRWAWGGRKFGGGGGGEKAMVLCPFTVCSA
jgi:hypothetical protein